MPLRYLFEPWKAPLSVQQKAKCIVGVDYPKPIVDHQVASKECIANMKAVKDALMGKGEFYSLSGGDKESSGLHSVRPSVCLSLCHNLVFQTFSSF